MDMLSNLFCYIFAACLVYASFATMADGKKMPRNIKIFMCGDIMTGRGIDQVLPHLSDPLIHESYLKNARGYVTLAEAANGPIRQPVSFGYIWGDALAELKRAAPDVSLINLETSITASNDFWKGKGIHYRMNPQNIASLTAANIDVCALANNHVLDWGYHIPRRQTEFAHRLIDDGGVDIVHGHSSHHVKAIEVYKSKLILYGCGDFLNDYEGISGYEEFRADLSLMYFATLDVSTGNLLDLQMAAMQIRRFQIQRASQADTRWLGETLNREGRPFGTRVIMHTNSHLALQW
jgi:poly-gamma-glutamate capsule biosynthesis protein CapA/YwtB (metallophosphatase superfamily)